MERGLCDWWICVERKGMVVPFLKFNFIHSFFYKYVQFPVEAKSAFKGMFD